MTIKNEVPIVIPYLAREAQGNELELAVTGWRKHFVDPYHIYIVGDSHPIVSSGDDITFVDCPQIDIKDDNYLPHMDHVNKFIAVSEILTKQLCPHFIYTCDDIYPVNDFSLIEVLYPKVTGKMSGRDANCKTGWWGDLQRTRRKCIEKGLPTWDWVCHLPVHYMIYELMQIYDKYDCTHTSYVVENLYFNEIYKGRIPLQLNGSDNLKYAVNNSPIDSYEFERALQNKIFITNSNSGWSQELEDRLRKHYNQ